MIKDEPNEGLYPSRAGFSLPPKGTLKQLWTGLDFLPAKQKYHVAEAYLNDLRRLYCEAAFTSLEVPPSSEFRWFASRGRLDEIKFFDRFWRTPSVRAALPALEIGRAFRCRIPFKPGNAFSLDGEFAAALFTGGCYSKYRDTPAAAKAVGQRVSHDLIGERHDEIYVYCNHEPWCEAFEGMMVTWTWVILDLRHAIIHVLYASDVD